MAIRHKRQAIFSEINITPLTDIFLVLLILMMVIAPMLDSQGISLATPNLDTTGKTTQEPKAINLLVGGDGLYTMNGIKVPQLKLSSELRAITAKYPDGLILQVAPVASHGDMVAALDAAKHAGLKKIAVVRQD